MCIVEYLQAVRRRFVAMSILPVDIISDFVTIKTIFNSQYIQDTISFWRNNPLIVVGLSFIKDLVNAIYDF